MKNARKLVVKLLTRMDVNNSYSNLLLSDALDKSELSNQDKKFASALFYGVIERKYTLDQIIRKLSAIKSHKLNPEVRNIIRIALYQLLYMDAVPDNAAVDESVKLVKQTRNPTCSGYVNAILREFIRSGKKLPVKNCRTEQLAVDYSCPPWLVSKWFSEYKDNICYDMLRSSLGKAPISVRVNTVYAPFNDTLKMLDDEGIRYDIIKVLPDCLNLHMSGSVENTNAYRSGRLHVQDISSQFCAAALEAKENDIVLDMCAAPGGKTFTIAEHMKDKGTIYAFDLHENRVKLIKDGAKRLGLKCIKARTNDGKEYSTDMPKADRVLCDVPCSGLGVIRRKPEIKYKDPADFERLPEIQYKILDNSASYVKRNGILVYSTCTLSRAENDEVVDKFLQFHPEYVSCKLGEFFGYDKNKTRVTITPGVFNSDGFFIAKFRRIR